MRLSRLSPLNHAEDINAEASSMETGDSHVKNWFSAGSSISVCSLEPPLSSLVDFSIIPGITSISAIQALDFKFTSTTSH